jgi:hypothetical protein
MITTGIHGEIWRAIMSELELSVEEQVCASAAQVWSYVVEHYFENHSLWDPAIVAMDKLTPGGVGMGTRGRETRRLFVGRQATDFEVVACEPRTRFVFRNTSGPFELEREYRLAEDGGRTALRFRFQMKPRGPMKLVFPLLRNTVERQVRENMARIPALIAPKA